MSYVLVVEDDPYIQLMISRKLQNAGFQVYATADGREALARALSITPAIMLLDIMLPETNGLDICKTIKSTLGAQSPPVIMISANGQPSDVDAARAVGADDYLIKPFSPSDLLIHVKALVRS